MNVPFRASHARAAIFCLFSTTLLGTACPEGVVENIRALRVTIEGDGEVTPCCTGLYQVGTVVQLTATPGLGWVFKSWRGNAGVGITTSLVLDVLMDRDKDIIATFEPRPINEDDLKATGRKPLP